MYYYWRSTLAADKEMNRHQCFFLTVCRSPVIAFKRAFDEWTFILSVRCCCCQVAKLHFPQCSKKRKKLCGDKNVWPTTLRPLHSKKHWLQALTQWPNHSVWINSPNYTFLYFRPLSLTYKIYSHIDYWHWQCYRNRQFRCFYSYPMKVLICTPMQYNYSL